MIRTFGNRVFGLVGGIRVGKDSVANFLTETRGFKQFAFADQIKEEFGISKEDFEASKIAGNIEELRTKLWDFSAAKKKEDPLYFIKKVINRVRNYDGNVIITDIRTEEELASFFKMELGSNLKLKRLYWIRGNFDQEIDKNDMINGSKLLRSTMSSYFSPSLPEYDTHSIFNDRKGLYAFYQKLDKFFFQEDIKDIWNNHALNNIDLYLDQFEVKLKERR